jgi:hypothetical protein
MHSTMSRNKSYFQACDPKGRFFKYDTLEDLASVMIFSEQSGGYHLAKRVRPEEFQRSSSRSSLADRGAKTEEHYSYPTTPRSAPDGRTLADLLASNPCQFYTNKPSAGWCPAIDQRLTEFNHYCRDDSHETSGSIVEDLQQKIDHLSLGTSSPGSIRLISLPAHQATAFFEKKLVTDMSDQNSICSPAVEALTRLPTPKGVPPPTIGVYSHPEFGSTALCTRDTKDRFRTDPTFRDDRLIASIGLRTPMNWQDPEAQVNEVLEMSDSPPGLCKFVKLTSSEYDELSNHSSLAYQIHELEGAGEDIFLTLGFQ